MKLVCTDQGQHPLRVLGWLHVNVDGGGRHAVFVPWVPLRRLYDRPGPQSGTLQVRCPSCRDTLPMRQETALRLLDTLRRDEWDVSTRR